MSVLCVKTTSPCSHCDGCGVVDHEECPTCAGTGDDPTYSSPTASDLVAHVASLPCDEQARTLKLLLASLETSPWALVALALLSAWASSAPRLWKPSVAILALSVTS